MNSNQARDIDEARRFLSETLHAFKVLAPKAMLTLEEGFEDVMAVMNFPANIKKC